MKPIGWDRLEQDKESWMQRLMWLDTKLEIEYRSPTHGNYKNPTSELFYILLSKITNPMLYKKVFVKFASKYRPWNSLLVTPVAELEFLFRPLGLSSIRSQQILEIAKILKEDFHNVTLSPLRKMPTTKAKEYLLKLPGVGEKSARCVLMYSLGRDISPMDTHAMRIMFRFGLLPDTKPTNAHRIMDDRLPEGVARRLHVNLVAHGRAICQGQHPKCDICVVSGSCFFFFQISSSSSDDFQSR